MRESRPNSNSEYANVYIGLSAAVSAKPPPSSAPRFGATITAKPKYEMPRPSKPQYDTPNGIHWITTGGIFCRRSGGAAATSRYAPPTIAGNSTPRQNEYAVNGNSSGLMVYGTTIDATSARPAR